MTNAITKTEKKHNALMLGLSEKYGMEPAEIWNTVARTLMPANATNDNIAAFLLVANQYGLNPFTKEIYAFSTGAKGIQTIVPIDGWVKLINDHPANDGFEFVDDWNGETLVSITCKMYRKDRAHPSEVTEYMHECKKPTDPWKKWPARMLRHKALIQCARYAYGFSGIIDQDEADRYSDMPMQDVEQSAHKKSLSGLADIGKGVDTVDDDTKQAEPITIDATTADDPPDPEILFDLFEQFEVPDDKRSEYLGWYFGVEKWDDLKDLSADQYHDGFDKLKAAITTTTGG